MKLDRYRLLHEDAKDFHLEHEEHGAITVPKAHLHFATVEKIQKHFAKGGEVDDPTQEEKDAAALLGMPLPQQAPTGQAVVGDDAQGFLAQPGAPAPGPSAAPPTTPVSLPDRQIPPLSGAPSALPQPPSPTAGLDAGIAQEKAGVQAEGRAKEMWGNEAASMQQAAARQQEMLGQRQQELITQRAAGAQKLADDVLSQKMNPDHFWETRSTGQKISAAIGLVLGGIGAGLTKGPNYALQVIDKAIDRDIEAQKFNLQQGKNKLAFYMQQTGDLVSASQLAKADALTVTGAKLQSAIASMGASMAGPEVQKALGAIQVQAEQLRNQGTMAQMQIEQTKIGMQYQKAQMGLLSNVMGQAGQGGAGITIPPGAEMLLPKEMQETLVRLPGGKVDFARSSKDAEDVRKTQETSSILRKKLQRYRALQQGHPNGISEIASPTDYNAATALHESIITDLNGLAGLSRFTPEEHQVFVGRLPKIWKAGRSAPAESQLDELGQELDDKINASNRAYLKFSGAR